MRGIKFKVFASNSAFYYYIVGTNGDVVCVSQSYPTLYGAHRALKDLWAGFLAALDTSTDPPQIPYTEDSIPAPR